MSRVRVVPYGPSESSKELAEALGGRRVKLQGSQFRPRRNDVIINWGHGVDNWPTNIPMDCVVNKPEAIALASNKLECLHTLRRARVNIPLYTTQQEAVRGWLQDGKRVFARTLLRANSGRGIVELEGGDCSIPNAPLYTQYINKTHEYRTHVFQGRVIDTQRKMRRTDVPVEAVNWRIRNMDNGFIFGRGGITESQERDAQALAAVAALGLDFGAVDIIYNERRNEYYVLEVNTAPGLAGTTLEKYTEAFTGLRG